MNPQLTSHILMIRPVNFQYNAETAVNNHYQQDPEDINATQAQNAALKEFDEMVRSLRYNGILVTVIEDTSETYTPDSIFPNNWISLHSDGTLGLYPMFAENRRRERSKHVLDTISSHFSVTKTLDFTHFEQENKFLEGTGSLILDRVNKIAYAARSARTHPDLVDEFGRVFGYRTVVFTANQSVDNERLPIYHTNVMMCLGEDFSVICLDAIDNDSEKFRVIQHLEESGKRIIDITEAQVQAFAGNMLQVVNQEGKRFIVMSSSAYHSLTASQIKDLEQSGTLIHNNLSTIEACGGGSARCMMAEIFLPPKEA